MLYKVGLNLTFELVTQSDAPLYLKQLCCEKSIKCHTFQSLVWDQRRHILPASAVYHTVAVYGHQLLILPLGSGDPALAQNSMWVILEN